MAVVVEPPLGSAQDAAGGKFEEDGVDVTVLIVRGVVGQALQEATGAEGEEQVLVVHIVERQHGAAGQQELGGEGLEAERLKRDAKRRVGAPGGHKRGSGQQEEHKEAEAMAEPRGREDVGGNRHGCVHVSVLFDRA